VLDPEPRVAAVKAALQERQLGPAADGGEVIPGQRDGPSFWRPGAVIIPTGTRSEVGVSIIARVEGMPQHVVAIAEHRKIDRQRDRLVSGRLGALDEVAGQPAITLDVELEPARCTGCNPL